MIRGAFVLVLVQFERRRIDAVPQTCRLWPVIEDMPQVGVAPAALCLDALHAVAGVRLALHSLLAGRSEEARPSGARVVFCFRTKQRLAAADALIGTRRLGILIFPGKRRLGSFLPRHIVLILRELFLPVAWCLADFLFHSLSLIYPQIWYLACPTVSDTTQHLDVSAFCTNSGISPSGSKPCPTKKQPWLSIPISSTPNCGAAAGRRLPARFECALPSPATTILRICLPASTPPRRVSTSSPAAKPTIPVCAFS